MIEEKRVPIFSRNEFKAWAWNRFKWDDRFTAEHQQKVLDICNSEWTIEDRKKALDMVSEFMGEEVAKIYFSSKRHNEIFCSFMDTMHKSKNTPDCIFWEFEDLTGAVQKEPIKGIDDGGERITYGEGMATREPSSGKGRFDLITPFGLCRLARWYELGGYKYSPRNWEKGIPFSRYLDSAMRHLNKFLMGMDDEDHLSAAAWNIFAIIHHQELGQWELDDLPHYKGRGYGAGEVPNSSVPDWFWENLGKDVKEFYSKYNEENKKVEAGMKAQIEDLEAKLAAIDQEEEGRKKLIDAIKNAAPKNIDNIIKQGPTYPACFTGGLA